MRALALVMLAASAASAQQQDFSQVEIKTTKVSGNVYMLEGAGGNIAATVGDDGVAIVDDQFAPLSPKIRAALAKLSPKPVRFVINTHWHRDHVGGNADFAETAAILAHANVRKRMQSGGKTAFFDVPPAAPAALPVITFEDGVSLFWNGEEIRAIHLHPGHTDGDSAVWFTRSNVVHLGDDYFAHVFPFIDLENQGSVQGLILALDQILAAGLPADVKVMSGHAQVATLDEVRSFRDAVDSMISAVRKGLRSGKTLAQLQQEKVLGPWEAAWGKGFIKTDDFISMIARDLATKK